jgi:hypothetical protein
VAQHYIMYNNTDGPPSGYSRCRSRKSSEKG